jgi:hypothetical protein
MKAHEIRLCFQYLPCLLRLLVRGLWRVGSHPLRQLQQRVHWLMALDWEKSAIPIQLKTPAFFNSKMDEVDDLAHSFNQMAKKLQYSLIPFSAI